MLGRRVGDGINTGQTVEKILAGIAETAPVETGSADRDVSVGEAPRVGYA